METVYDQLAEINKRINKLRNEIAELEARKDYLVEKSREEIRNSIHLEDDTF